MPGAALSMGHTGGFLDFAGVSWRFGRMHAVGVEETEETELMEEDMVAQIFCPILTASLIYPVTSRKL